MRLFKLTLILFVLCTNVVIAQTTPDDCVLSFHEFAYEGGDRLNIGSVSPVLPWQLVSSTPQNSEVRSGSLKIARTINDHQEIWSLARREQTFLVYYSGEQNWEFISAKIGEEGLFVDNLYVDSQGILWGSITWDYGRNTTAEVMPVVAKFNDDTRKFEVAEGIVEIPLERNATYSETEVSIHKPNIILDHNDVFWIFDNEGIVYYYDSRVHLVTEHVTFSAFFQDRVSKYVISPVLAPDGSIYFVNYPHEFGMIAPLIPDSLFQFFPSTGEIVELSVPDEQWPVSSNMYVDHAGRLWVDSTGYRSSDGVWHTLHSNIEDIFDTVQWLYWLPLELMLESSDGTLWFRRTQDHGGVVDGVAWYNPETNEGCLVTTYMINVVEDSEQRLWMGGGTLYSYDLNR